MRYKDHPEMYLVSALVALVATAVIGSVLGLWVHPAGIWRPLSVGALWAGCFLAACFVAPLFD